MKKIYYVVLSILCLGTTSKLQAQDTPQLQWVFNAVNASVLGASNEGRSIAVDASGNRYVTGNFAGTADFDPSAATANLTAAGGNDIFIAKYAANGIYLWAKAMGGTGVDQATGIALDSSGQVYITGYFQVDVDFDPSSATANLSSAGGNDIFIAKYDTGGNYLWAKALGGTSDDLAYGIALDSSDQAHITGNFVGTADFDPSAATANLTSVGFNDIFIAKYDASGNYLWAKAMGDASVDQAIAIALDSNGQVHITGYFNGTVDFDPSAASANITSVGNYDIFIAKYDAGGNYLWARAIGNVSNDYSTGIALDSGGQVHITGYFVGTVDFDPSAAVDNLTAAAGGSDIFIAKYDIDGNYLWAKAMRGTGNDQATGITLDSGGQVHITGYFVGTVDFDPSAAVDNLTSAGGNDIFIAKYDTGGNYLWANAIGGTGSDVSYGIALDSSSVSFHITGVFNGTVDFDPSATTVNLTSGSGVSNCFVVEYSRAEGWGGRALSIGGYSSTVYGEESKAVVTDALGNVYVTGYFSSTVDFDPSAAIANLTSAGGNDIFIAKYDHSGNYLWAKAMWGSTLNDQSNAIALDSSGNVHIAGVFQNTVDFDPSGSIANLTAVGNYDIFIAKYDINGNYLWAKAMGGTSTDIATGIALDSSSQVHITGYFISTADFDPSVTNADLTSVGGNDIFIAKYDASGNYLWAKAMGGTNNDQSNGIALDSSGQVHITGSFTGTVDFDPSGLTTNLTTAGGSDIFIAKYDAGGNYLWAKAMGGTNTDQANAIALNSSGRVHITGSFQAAADFDPSGLTANLTSAGGSDIFIAKYDASGNYLWAKAMGGTGTDISYGVALDSTGQVHFTGYFNGTADFDSSGSTANLTSVGSQDLFIAKYDTGGNYLWAKAMGGIGTDMSFAIALDSSDQVHCAGYFNGTADFEPLSTSGSLASLNTKDLFLAQYKQCTAAVPTVTISGDTLTVDATADTYQWIDCTNGNAIIPGATNQSFTPVVDGNYAVILNASGCQSTSSCQSVAVLSVNEQTFTGVKVFPNPTTGRVTITMPFATQEVKAEVINMLGKVIKTVHSKVHNEISISLDDVAKGMYFIRLQSDQKANTYKVMKQ